MHLNNQPTKHTKPNILIRKVHTIYLHVSEGQIATHKAKNVRDYTNREEEKSG